MPGRLHPLGPEAVDLRAQLLRCALVAQHHVGDRPPLLVARLGGDAGAGVVLGQAAGDQPGHPDGLRGLDHEDEVVGGGLAGLDRHARNRAEQEQVLAALRYKCDILWAQIDALHHAYVEPGHIPPGAFVPDREAA